jgi:hypothetical protein
VSPDARRFSIPNVYLVFSLCLTPVLRFDATMKDVDGNDDHHKERKGGLFNSVDMSRSIADELPSWTRYFYCSDQHTLQMFSESCRQAMI